MESEPEARFGRILQAHGPSLRRLAAAYARVSSDADDLLQDICFAIWRALPRFRGDCSERTFVYRIGHNRGLSFRVKQRSLIDLDDGLADPRERPDDAASRADDRDRLFAAVRRLPEGQRQVVVMGLEGLSNREIGDVLGITENTVATRLSRARKALRDLLGGGSAT
ncbi:MAG: RNA polymerase sigma factor [Gemmatimonadota bacterium]